MASRGPSNTTGDQSSSNRTSTSKSSSGGGTDVSNAKGGGISGAVAAFMPRVLGSSCHRVRSPAQRLASARAVAAGIESTLAAQRQKYPLPDWRPFEDAAMALIDAANRLDPNGPNAAAELEQLEGALESLYQQLLDQVKDAFAQAQAMRPISSVAALQVFLSHSLLATHGRGQNGQLPFVLSNVGSDASGKPKWLFTKPPAGKPPGVAAYNFIMNPVVNCLDATNAVIGQPDYLTIPSDSPDAMVTTGMVNGCTLATFKLPNGDLKLVHLQPREDSKRPRDNQIPGDKALPPGQPGKTTMTDQEVHDYLAAENAAMRKLVQDYADSLNATNVSFFQSDYGQDSASAYDRKAYAYNNIIGYVENGVLRLFAQQVPVPGSPTPIAVKEIFTVPLG